MPNALGFSRGSRLTVWGSVFPFALPDKMNIGPLMYHLQAAGFTGVVFPVPPFIYWPDPAESPDFSDLLVWATAARSHGLAVILDLGPTFEVGLPWRGVPVAWWRAGPDERLQLMSRWWQAIRSHVSRDGVVFRRRNPLLGQEAVDALAREVWRGRDAWAVDDWPLLDVQDLTWQEWNEDQAWWARVDALDPALPVRVRFWWPAAHRDTPRPDPDAVHEEIGPLMVPTLLASLWARGVRWLWWEPVRGGLLWGIDAPALGSPVLDGGAAFRSWGMPTPTWRSLRRALQHAHALRVGTFTWEPEERVEGEEATWLACGTNFLGEVWALRCLTEGEVAVLPPYAQHPVIRVTGPTGFLVPRMIEILDGKGKLRLALMPLLYREHLPQRETWVFDCYEGGAIWVDVPGALVYQTGVHVEQEGPSSWHVVFEAGKPGQVLWQVGQEQLHLVGIDRYQAERVWPRGLAGGLPLMWGASQMVAAQVIGPDRWKVRVTTDTPTALVVCDERPWQMRVEETGKESVWGARSGVGGVALGGPKEWGAPRVMLPELRWESKPWAGPQTLDGWQPWTGFFPAPLSPGWHWFRVVAPPYWQEIRLEVLGVADVWLGNRRIAGVRSVDARRERRILLPPREDPLPLTCLVWVPTFASESTLVGWFGVALPEETMPLWEYRSGLPGLRVRGPFWRWDGHREPPPAWPTPEEAALWCHEANVRLSVPNAAWVQLGLTLGDVGELVWVFVNGVLVARWWAGWTREPALWIPPDFLSYHGENRLVLLHWPRGKPIDLTPVQLVQLGRERVSTVVMERASRPL